MFSPQRSAQENSGSPLRHFGGLMAAVVSIGLMVGLHRQGISSGALCAYAAYLVFGLLAPGVVVKRLVWGAGRTWLTDVAFGFCFGLSLELMAWMLFSLVGAQHALFIWPAFVFAALFAKSVRERVLVRPAEYVDPVGVIALLCGGGSLTWWLFKSDFLSQALPGKGRPLYPDILWHMGLVNEARRSFPLGTPQAIGAGTLHYHWFSDAHMAAATLISGVSVPQETLRFFPLFVSLLAFAITAATASELSQSRFALPFAALLAGATTTFMPFSWLYATYTSYIPLSPSQLFAVPFTVVAVYAVIRLVATNLAGPGSRSAYVGPIVGCLILAFALSGAKASAPPTLLGGLGLLWLWSMAAKRARSITSSLVVGGVVLAGIALTLVAGGDSGSTKQLFAAFGPQGAFKHVVNSNPGMGAVLPGFFSHPVAASGLLLFHVFGLAAMFLVLAVMVSPAGRANPLWWLLGGCFIAADLAFLLIRHPGLSEYYFIFGIIALSIVGIAVFLADSLERGTAAQRQRLWVIFALSLVGGVVVRFSQDGLVPRYADYYKDVCWSLVVALVGIIVVFFLQRWSKAGALATIAAVALGLNAAPTLADPFHIHTKPARISGVERDYEDAGLWISSHTSDNALMATNQHCLGRERKVCVSRRWWISGLGGRSVLVDGWSYTPKSANQDPFFDQSLLDHNQGAFERADSADLSYLKSRHVQYLVAVKGATKLSPELNQVGELVYHNDDVSIYRVK